MVVVLGGCATDGGGAATDLGNNEQGFHEANSSHLAKFEVQVVCNVSRDRDGCSSTQVNVESRGGTSIGFVEADRIDLEGGGEVDASC